MDKGAKGEGVAGINGDDSPWAPSFPLRLIGQRSLSPSRMVVRIGYSEEVHALSPSLSLHVHVCVT